MAKVTFKGVEYDNINRVAFDGDENIFYSTEVSTETAAKATDIKRGKQAWVNGSLINGTHEETDVEPANLGTKLIQATNSTEIYYARDDDLDGWSQVTVQPAASAKIKDNTIVWGYDTEYTVDAADEGYDGYKTVTVRPTTEGPKIEENHQTRILDTAGEIRPTAGYSAMSKVTYNIVPSELDANIQPYNIKKGVSILGINGTYEAVVKKDAVYMLCTGTGSTSASYRVYVVGSDLNESTYQYFYYSYRYKTTGSWNSGGARSTVLWDSSRGAAYVEFASVSTNRTYEITFENADSSWTITANTSVSLSNYKYYGNWYGATGENGAFTFSTTAIDEPDFNASEESDGGATIIEGYFRPNLSEHSYPKAGVDIAVKGVPKIISVWTYGSAPSAAISGEYRRVYNATYIRDSSSGGDYYAIQMLAGYFSSSGEYVYDRWRTTSQENIIVDDISNDDGTNAFSVIQTDGKVVRFHTYDDTQRNTKFALDTTYYYTIVCD